MASMTRNWKIGEFIRKESDATPEERFSFFPSNVCGSKSGVKKGEFIVWPCRILTHHA